MIQQSKQKNGLGKTKWLKPFFMSFLLCLLCLGVRQKTEAAANAWESAPLSFGSKEYQHYCAGGLYVWTNTENTELYYSKRYSGTGKKLWSVSPGESLMLEKGEFWRSARFCTDGTYLFFAVYKKDSSKATVLRINIKTGKVKNICTYKSSYGVFYGYYKNQILLAREFHNSIGISLYSYNIKTKKNRCIKKNIDDGGSRQYGKYVVYLNVNGAGIYPENLYVRNIDTGKTVKISKNASYVRIINGKVYFLEELKNGWGIIKSSTMTGKVKNITGKFRWYGTALSCSMLLQKNYAVVMVSTLNEKGFFTDKKDYFKVTYNTKNIQKITKIL